MGVEFGEDGQEELVSLTEAVVNGDIEGDRVDGVDDILSSSLSLSPPSWRSPSMRLACSTVGVELETGVSATWGVSESGRGLVL